MKNCFIFSKYDLAPKNNYHRNKTTEAIIIRASKEYMEERKYFPSSFMHIISTTKCMPNIYVKFFFLNALSEGHYNLNVLRFPVVY